MRTLYVNGVGIEKRIAVEEEGEVVELFIERPDEQEIVGNVYKGRVTKVLPGMGAAFVDIGLEKQAYLHRDYIVGSETGKAVQQLVHEGQTIMVQVIKGPVDTKGPKVTNKPEFTGTYTVYLPHEEMAAVSRNIEEKERKRELQQLGAKHKGGFIFRSACKEVDIAVIEAEMEQIQQLYKKIEQGSEKAPSLLYTATSFLDRVLQQIPISTLSHIIVDHRADESFFLNQVERERVTFYREKESLFQHYGIENEMEKALKKIVWLANGAYILIEETETMTVIDVNTGKFTGKGAQTETTLATNLQAAEAIARQLRLRDIGGMIAIDFINMKDRAHQERVKQTLLAGLKKDGAPYRVFDFTALGILEMTRKRKRKSLRDTLLVPCTCCKGAGVHASTETIVHALIRDIGQYSAYEAVGIETNVEVKTLFESLQQQFTLPVAVYIKEQKTTTYSIRHAGTEEEIKARFRG